MNPAQISEQITMMMQAGLAFAGPALLVATALGLIIGILQAVTQIQDQTLPQTVKIIGISLFLLFAGARLAIPLVEQTEELFLTFHTRIL